MPRFSPETLSSIGREIFSALGCSETDAATVADHLVGSSLFGHDSHGTLRFYEYLEAIRDGRWNPTGRPRIVREKPSTAVVDGGGAMGQVGATFATQLAIEKARRHGVASVTLRNTCHIGRCGAYPLLAATNEMIGLLFVNAGSLGRQTAPYGGTDGKLSTNPIAFAAPRRDRDPIMVDMATAATAEGKVRVYRNRNEAVPEGWLTDRNGKISTDPSDYLSRAGGALLPLGGVAAHKGYCLSMMVEILGGALSGEGCASGESAMISNGVLITVFNIEHFVDFQEYYDDLEVLIAHVLSSQVDPEVGQIQLPGEPEFRCAKRHGANGIEIDTTTWAHICKGADSLGLDSRRWNQQRLG